MARSITELLQLKQRQEAEKAKAVAEAARQASSPSNQQNGARPNQNQYRGGGNNPNHRGGGGYGRGGQGGGGREPPAPREVPQNLLKAQYRFVPYDPKLIVLAEPEAMRPINEPKENGLSAEITVNWIADGPLLIGQAGEKDPTITEPLQWGADGEFVIPGSTLRGAIRSVAQIIGAGRMARAHVSGDHVFGLRDFNHEAYAKSGRYPVSNPAKVKAGWLRVEGGLKDAGIALKAWIEPAKQWYLYDPISIAKPEPYDTDAVKRGLREAFTKLGLKQKYEEAALTKNDNICTHGVTQNYTKLTRPRTWPHRIPYHPIVAEDPKGTIKGHVVFSSKAPKGKQWEYVIEGSPGTNVANEVEISQEIWQRFIKMHSSFHKNGRKAEQSWEVFHTMLGRDMSLRIPVFYVGTLKDQDPKTFAFGLTRLFKVPHTHTMEDVFQASGLADPIDDQLDMIDALFGYVYERPQANPQDPQDVALKGRVSFSHATLNGHHRLTETVSPAMLAPRPSFAPFYTAGDIKDYSAPDVPIIAGAKRYPAKTSGVTPTTATNSIMGRLKAQAAGGQGNTASKLKLLAPANDQSPLAFQSKVRLHNVTLAELGLVYSALTLNSQQRRHMIGRAKGFGSGQMRARITGLAVDWNDGRESDINTIFETAVREFQKYRADALAEHKEEFYRSVLDAFFATCDPQRGAQALASLNALAPVGLFAEVRASTKPDTRPNIGLHDNRTRLMSGLNLPPRPNP